MSKNYTITKLVDFCAAHSLKGAGKCERKHGHNWEATITVSLDGELDRRGFIADVADIKNAAFKYDHDDLDLYFETPSTELVCRKIAADALDVCLVGDARGDFVVTVSLVETRNNSAQYCCWGSNKSTPSISSEDK